MCTYVFILLEYRSRIAGSHVNSVFNFLRNCQTVFQRGRIILYSNKKYVRLPISPHPCQHLILSVFFVLFILVGVEWHLIVVLICISLMANDVEHLFMCFLAICVPNLEIRLFRSFAHYVIGPFVLYS